MYSVGGLSEPLITAYIDHSPDHDIHLVAKFKRVPGFAAEVLDPRLPRFGRCRLFDVTQGLVEEDVTAGGVGLADQTTRGQGSLPHAGALQFDPPADAQFDQDAASKTRRYAVVPEGGVPLAILEAQQENLASAAVRQTMLRNIISNQ
jgi:hypothetical protein